MTSIRRVCAYAATALVCGAAGWWIGAADTPPNDAHHPPATMPAAPPAVAVPAQVDEPLIAVSGDGNVTLRVEQQPLEWVLEQIAKHSGWGDVRQRAGLAPAGSGKAALPPTPAAVACPEPVSPMRSTQLLQMIERGSEADRHGGLMLARSNGVTVPGQTLKLMFETDASDRVRLAALDGYLEPLSGDTAAMRAALEAALLVPNAAVQRDAMRRLDELHESMRIDAAVVQKAEP